MKIHHTKLHPLQHTQTSQRLCARQDASCRRAMPAIEELSPPNTADMISLPEQAAYHIWLHVISQYTRTICYRARDEKALVISTQRFYPWLCIKDVSSEDKVSSSQRPPQIPQRQENSKSNQNFPPESFPRIYRRPQRRCVIDTCAVSLLILCNPCPQSK